MGDEVGRNTRWFYCLKHQAVEPEGQCKATDRLGPYPTPDAAAGALTALHEREERLEQEDRQWRGDDEPGA